jgi:hypothetical protein
MARPISSVTKTALNCSVSLSSKELLEAKSKAYGKSMSDLVDRLIVECFSPKKGLAKRLESDKSAAVKLNTETKSEAARDSDSKKLEACRLLEAAKLEAGRLLEAAELEASRLFTSSELEYSRISAEADLELKEAIDLAESSWGGSIQSMLLEQFTGTCTQENLEFVNRWLFDNRILAAKDKQGSWNSCGSCWRAAHSYMTSTMIKDKLLAADLAAEAETYELPEEAFSYLASCYDNDLEALFTAYDSPKDSPSFYRYCKETDELYGTKLLEHMPDYGSDLIKFEQLAKAEAATELVMDNHLANDWTLELLLKDEGMKKFHVAAAKRLANR